MSGRKPTGKTRDLVPAAASAKTKTVELPLVRKPLSATTLRAIQREPVKGGSYSVLKSKDAPKISCEVSVTTHGVRIDIAGKKLVLSPAEARVLALKLGHALA